MVRGFVLTFDALFAGVVILMVFVIASGIQMEGMRNSGREEFKRVHYISEDVMEVLNKKGVLDEIASNWAMADGDRNSSYWANASSMARLHFSGLIPPNMGYRLLLDGQEVYSEERVPEGSAGVKTHALRILTGYKPGESPVGFVSRAYLVNVKNPLASGYMYFGGFEGQGNLTKKIMLASDAKPVGAFMELNAGGPFDLYVNGAYCLSFLPSSGAGLGANVKENLTCYLLFKGAENLVELRFKGDRQSDYVGGGYLRVDYTTSELDSYPHNSEYLFPGVAGWINIYSSFYVPGELSSIEGYLHYKSDTVKKLVIGNAAVFIGNGTGEQEYYLSSSDIRNNLSRSGFSYALLSQKTVPLRLLTLISNGTIATNITETIKTSKPADAVLITDMSGSMSGKDITHHHHADPTQPPELDTRLNVTKEVDAIFVDEILDNPGSRVGLVSYASGPGVQSTHDLSTDQPSLIAQIKGYSPTGCTCISCGVKAAFDILNASSDASRSRSMLVMSDGEANTLIPGSCGCCDGGVYSKMEAVSMACRAREEGIDVYSVAFGSTAGSVDTLTLKKIACWNCTANGWMAGENATNCSRFYQSGDAEELIDIYKTISEHVLTSGNETYLNVTYSAQVLNVTGNISLGDDLLYPDSYLRFSYTPAAPPLEYGEVFMTRETEAFGNGATTGGFYVPLNARPLDARVTSYSSSYWTHRLRISGASGGWKDCYSLPYYGNDYVLLGDPYTVEIPIGLLSAGTNNVAIGTGASPAADVGGSPDDKAIYSMAVKFYADYGAPLASNEGCKWRVEFQDVSTRVILVPSDYSGENTCSYTSTGIKSLNESSISEAFYRMLSNMDVLPHDGRVDILFDPVDVKVEASETAGIRSMWGPVEANLVVWIK